MARLFRASRHLSLSSKDLKTNASTSFRCRDFFVENILISRLEEKVANKQAAESTRHSVDKCAMKLLG